MARICNDVPGQYLESSSVLLTAAPFTFLIWGRSTDGADNFQSVGIMSQAGTNNFWRIRLRITVPQIEFRAESATEGGGTAMVSTAPSVNTWAHYAFVEAANNDRAGWLDGANKATDTTTVTPAGINTTHFGQLDDGTPDDRFIGDLGHAALYNIAFTDQDIESLAAGVSPLRMHRDSLVGLWPLNGRDPEYNVMGTGVNLTLVGAPPIAEEPPIHRSIIAV